MPEPNYDHRFFDESFITEPGLGPDSEFLIRLSLLGFGEPAYAILQGLDIGIGLGDPEDPFGTSEMTWWADRNDARQQLLYASLVAQLAGNDDATRNLQWFVLGLGQPMTDLPVDRMLEELQGDPLQPLSAFADQVEHINQTSLPGLLDKDPTHVIGNYEIYVNRTVLALDESGREIWPRVGQPSPVSATLSNPYIGNDGQGIDLSFSSQDFQYMYSGAEPTRYSREEFDWFIAMNAFDFANSQVVVVDKNTGNAQLYYRVDVADEYAWYDNEGTGLVDKIMAELDEKGVGEWIK